MLNQLYIENIAVIEKANIEFGPGFNVLTGETGAGKSIMIDAIHAVLGERTSRELVRSGEKGAYVSASFSGLNDAVLQKLDALGFVPEEDGTLLLQREIRVDGRTVCRVGSRPAPAAALRELGAQLLQIHGQHESLGLLAPENHLHYIDRMGVPPETRRAYTDAYRHWTKLCTQLQALDLDETEKQRRTDLLTYEIEELEDADLKPGEQARLQQRRAQFRSSARIEAAIGEASEALSGGEDALGAAGAVQAAAQALSSVAQVLPQAQALADRLSNAAYELLDCEEEIRALDSDPLDPQELEDIEARLDLLYRLSLKYGETEADMLAYLEHAKQELSQIEGSAEELVRLQAQEKAAAEQVKALGAALSEARRQAAASFQEKVRQELCYLDMPGVQFCVEQRPAKPGPTGCDRVQFLISANPGTPPRPLSKIASGGELSRIMLAIQSVLNLDSLSGTLIFDEVDAGVSGSAAQKIGKKLRETARGRQVLCVTHLAQIAAMGDRQYKIEKHIEDGRTFTDVTLLDDAGRTRELARMISGAQITPLALENAAEMLRLGAEA